MGEDNEKPSVKENSPAPMKTEEPKAAVRRIFVRSKNRVKYCDDSDSDEENQQKVKKRILPEWLTQLANVSPVPISGKKAAVVKKMWVDESFVSPSTPIAKHNDLLFKTFKHTGFRAKQWEIIRSLMIEKRDVVGVMATGYGKSLCFQYPAICLNGITLVVSPLIALMQDQVMDLEKKGIPACLLGSAQPDKDMPARIVSGKFCLVYASPEFLNSVSGEKMLEDARDKIKLIAIDEAHCVVQWGYEFRPDYCQLDKIRAIVPNVPILALTATATEQARQDIAKELNLKSPKFVVSSFDRPNLEFTIRSKTVLDKDRQRNISEKNKYDYWKDLKSFLQNTDGSNIIYALTRAETEKIAHALKSEHINCEHYHAGLQMEERTLKLEKFRTGKIQTMVATIAFGMGIDKRDVRAVIHYGAPGTLEKYYQEVGRAGRDGQPAKAITFVSSDDSNFHEWCLREKFMKEKVSDEHKEILREQQKEMRDFLDSKECRRRGVIKYFGDDPSSIAPRPECCDNCSLSLKTQRLSDLYEGVNDNGIYDFGPWAGILMSSIKAEKDAGIENIKKRIAAKHRSSESKMPYLWEAVVEQLRISGCVKMEKISVDDARDIIALKLTGNGRKWLRSSGSDRKLKLKAIGLMYAFFKKKKCNAPKIQSVPDSYSDDESDYDSFVDFDFAPGAPVVGIDTYYGNVVDDYDPENDNCSKEEDDTDECESDDSDVVFVGYVDNKVATIKVDDDDFEPKSKKAKISQR